MEIQGWPNYLIYKDGRVYNKKYKRFRKASIAKNTGYYYVDLYEDGFRSYQLIHRLIGIHYIPNPNNYPIIDHIDRNRLNNDISNLRWVDHSTNCQNTGMSINNKSGHKGISQEKRSGLWIYGKGYRNVNVKRGFKSKIDALCYKYIILLKIKCGLNL